MENERKDVGCIICTGGRVHAQLNMGERLTDLLNISRIYLLDGNEDMGMDGQIAYHLEKALLDYIGRDIDIRIIINVTDDKYIDPPGTPLAEGGNRCAGCGNWIEEQKTVWIDPKTGKATMEGNPYHTYCAPEERGSE